MKIPSLMPQKKSRLASLRHTASSSVAMAGLRVGRDPGWSFLENPWGNSEKIRKNIFFGKILRENHWKVLDSRSCSSLRIFNKSDHLDPFGKMAPIQGNPTARENNHAWSVAKKFSLTCLRCGVHLEPTWHVQNPKEFSLFLLSNMDIYGLKKSIWESCSCQLKGSV